MTSKISNISLRNKKIIILISIFISISIIFWAYYHRSTLVADPNIQEINVEDGDGSSGNPCYVVVENVLYEVTQGNKWVDGQHTTSDGQAYCGTDLSDVIKNSPHGKSILPLLKKVRDL